MREMETVLYIFLLSFCFAGTFQFKALHGLFHLHEHIVIHSEAQEQNACHRTIYHNEEERGCDHHSHILITDKCELCDLSFHTDHILLAKEQTSTLLFFQINPAVCSQDALSLSESPLSSRAPPAV